MRKLRKASICVLLSVLLAFSFTLGASAQGISNSRASIEAEIIGRKICEMIPLVFQDPIDVNDAIAIGNPLSVYRITENGRIQPSEYESYPLLINSEVKGIIDISRNENGNISQISLGVDYAPELQKAIENHDGEAFAIIHAYDGVYVKFLLDEHMCCLTSFFSQERGRSFPENETIEYSCLSPLERILLSFESPERATNQVFYNALLVYNVANTSTNCCPDGICWAASIAIMANYHLGTSYTSLQVHNLCGCLTSNYHSEEKSYIQQLGMYAGGPYYSTGNYPFCFSTLYDCIEADMLLLLDFQDFDEEVAHNVVAYGYYASTNSNSQYFYYMDPNTGARISSFPASPGDPVYVSLGGYNYVVHCYITAY